METDPFWQTGAEVVFSGERRDSLDCGRQHNFQYTLSSIRCFFAIYFSYLRLFPLNFSLTHSVYCVLYIVLPSSCDKQMLLFMYRGNYFPCPFLLSSFICSFFSIFLFHYLLSLPLFSAYILHSSQYIYIPGPDVPGEGEHKVMDMIRSFSEKVRLCDRMLCKRTM
jgi:hypothetical protein